MQIIFLENYQSDFFNKLFIYVKIFFFFINNLIIFPNFSRTLNFQ